MKRIVAVITSVTWDCFGCEENVTVQGPKDGTFDVVCPVCSLVSSFDVYPKGSGFVMPLTRLGWEYADGAKP